MPFLGKFDLQIKKNEVVALQGPNGSGKSTLALLLSGLFKPEEGSIKIGDQDLNEIKKADVRKNITLINQEAILFSMSIAENIAFGIPEDQIDYNKVITIANELGLRELIEEMPEGIHSMLGIKENTLSGGQKQLIALCRAFYFECPILILDEPTNNLDQQKVLLLIDKLRKSEKTQLVLIITHNPSLVAVADRVLYMQQGVIIEEKDVYSYS